MTTKKTKRTLPHLPTEKRKVTHLILAIDDSSSFFRFKKQRDEQMLQLVDSLVANSTKEDIEVRVSVYWFGYKVTQLVVNNTPEAFKKALGSLHYSDPGHCRQGSTALNQAIFHSILKHVDTVSTDSLDIAHLLYVLTDGGENSSTVKTSDVKREIEALNDDWTVILMGVADIKNYGKSIGIPPGNIHVWENTKESLEYGTQQVSGSTASYTTMRSAGIKKMSAYYQTDLSKLTQQAVTTSTKKLSKRDFNIVQNGENVVEMEPLMQAVGVEYKRGNHFYNLIKNETVGTEKQLIVMDKKTGYAYAGDGVRSLLKLPNTSVLMTPTLSPDYDVFVQSLAPNRKIMPKQKVLCLKTK